jgi:hypothetical protein
VSPRAVLTLLSKPGCHLCHELRAVVERVLPAFDATLEERDVRTDPQTARLYALEIPVLLLGTEEVVRHRATEDALRDRLTSLGLRRS